MLVEHIGLPHDASRHFGSAAAGVVDSMVTNFHLPKSTLLLLVSAFVNGSWREIYDYALANNFRFLNYGDSSLLMKE